MNTPAPRAQGLSPSGVVEAEKARGALTLLFSNLRAKNPQEDTQARQIREARQLINEMNEILEKKIG